MLLFAKLENLHRELQAMLKPVQGRRFYVYHPSWGHFAETYGLQQVSIEEHGKPVSDFEMTRVIQQAREDGVRALFVQPQVKAKSAQVVADVLKIRTESIDPLAANVMDNLRAVALKIKESLQ